VRPPRRRASAQQIEAREHQFILPGLAATDKLSASSPYPALLPPALPFLSPSALDAKPSEAAPFPPDAPRLPIYTQAVASTSKAALNLPGQDATLQGFTTRPDVGYLPRVAYRVIEARRAGLHRVHDARQGHGRHRRDRHRGLGTRFGCGLLRGAARGRAGLGFGAGAPAWPAEERVVERRGWDVRLPLGDEHQRGERLHGRRGLARAKGTGQHDEDSAGQGQSVDQPFAEAVDRHGAWLPLGRAASNPACRTDRPRAIAGEHCTLTSTSKRTC
jgi:hypothetical protein